METAAYCHMCGGALAADHAFCMSCGTRRVVPAPPSAQSPAPPQVLRQVQSAAGTAASIGGAAAALAGGGGLALPWQTIVAGQPIDAAGLARAAGPSLLAMAPRPNLRWPAAGIAFTVAMDLGIALVSGGAVNVPMLVMRVLTGLGTSLLGGIAGRGGGVLRMLTGVASILYGIVQLVSLAAGAFTALSNPSSLLVLVPSMVAVISGLVLSVSTAIAGFRK